MEHKYREHDSFSQYEELKNIIEQNGGCRMVMTDTGVFVIKIAPTTKG